MAGKYTPLGKYLKNIPANVSDMTLSFENIIEIIGSPLPYSAYHYPAWWSNEKHGNHVEAHAWMNAGWKVEDVDWGRKTVKFVKVT